MKPNYSEENFRSAALSPTLFTWTALWYSKSILGKRLGNNNQGLVTSSLTDLPAGVQSLLSNDGVQPEN